MDLDTKYGLDKIKSNLLQIQDHATTYPCPDCIRKHLLSAQAYIEETIPMVKDEKLKRKLKETLFWILRKRQELGDI